MNGVHDMGGMHGFGAVDVEDDAQFHADWERVTFAVDKVLRSQGLVNVDEKRHAIERLDPATYLGSSYFERWIAAWETMLVEEGLATEDEIRAALAAVEAAADPVAAVPDRRDPDLVEETRSSFESDASFDREPQEPRFDAGDEVVVRNVHPEGHTRCPRYVRRARGDVETVRGTFVCPDESAHGNEDVAEPLYSVRFRADELWGPDAETDDDSVYVDLWERYLDPADDT